MAQDVPLKSCPYCQPQVPSPRHWLLAQWHHGVAIGLQIDNDRQSRHGGIDEDGHLLWFCIFAYQSLSANEQLNTLLVQLMKQIQIGIAFGLESSRVGIIVEDRQGSVAMKNYSELLLGRAGSTAFVDVEVFGDRFDCRI